MMEITLVCKINSDEVHGTDNEKKTGCGINLLKPENVTRFRRNGTMNDLKEITCEKCKNALAKRIIKADKKEMSRLIKEEKARTKKGIVDENIVPLGNTVAKITSFHEEKIEKEAPVREKVTEPVVQKAPIPVQEEIKEKQEVEPTPAVVPKTIPGTGVAFDSSLAAFAINVPQQDAPQQDEEQTIAKENEQQDDFLAQFAINNTQNESNEEQPQQSTGQLQDDFLAQFAIPAPNQTVHDMNEEVEDNNDFNNQNYSQENNNQSELKLQDDDIMKMFSVTGQSQNSDVEVLSNNEQYDESSIYDEDESIIDVNDDELASSVPEENVFEDETSDEPEEDLSESADWDYVANKLFGFEGVDMPQQKNENLGEPEMDELTSEPQSEIEDISANVRNRELEIEDISAPVRNYEPEIEDISVPTRNYEPEIEDISAPTQSYESEIEDIAAPVENYESEYSDNTYEEYETYEEAEPESEATDYEDDSSQPYEYIYQKEQTADTIADIENTNPRGDVIMNSKHTYSAPVFADEFDKNEPTQNVSENANTEPNPLPNSSAPVSPIPVPQTVAPASIPSAAPFVQPPMTERPSVMSIPQFAGYDVNGQPVYTYIQVQVTGYDSNGQPVFAPIQPAEIPAPAAAPMAAPTQNVAVQNVAPTPSVSPETQTRVAPVQPIQSQHMGYRAPTANISKIGTFQHNKPMPKSFVNALAKSREQSKHNLIELQHKRVQMPVLDSVEDVLSQMGDESIKKNKAVEANIPAFEEYKGPVRSSSSGSSKSQSADFSRPLTKAEIKAQKKQEKIDQKFKKDLAKRGF